MLVDYTLMSLTILFFFSTGFFATWTPPSGALHDYYLCTRYAPGEAGISKLLGITPITTDKPLDKATGNLVSKDPLFFFFFHFHFCPIFEANIARRRY